MPHLAGYTRIGEAGEAGEFVRLFLFWGAVARDADAGTRARVDGHEEEPDGRRGHADGHAMLKTTLS